MPKFRRDVQPLLDRSIDSLTLGIDLFNRPTDTARAHAVPMLLHHAFEFVLVNPFDKYNLGEMSSLPKALERIRAGIANGVNVDDVWRRHRSRFTCTPSPPGGSPALAVSQKCTHRGPRASAARRS